MTSRRAGPRASGIARARGRAAWSSGGGKRRGSARITIKAGRANHLEGLPFGWDG
jgi:hypothetical protein